MCLDADNEITCESLTTDQDEDKYSDGSIVDSNEVHKQMKNDRKMSPRFGNFKDDQKLLKQQLCQDPNNTDKLPPYIG